MAVTKQVEEEPKLRGKELIENKVDFDKHEIILSNRQFNVTLKQDGSVNVEKKGLLRKKPEWEASFYPDNTIFFSTTKIEGPNRVVKISIKPGSLGGIDIQGSSQHIPIFGEQIMEAVSLAPEINKIRNYAPAKNLIEGWNSGARAASP